MKAKGTKLHIKREAEKKRKINRKNPNLSLNLEIDVRGLIRGLLVLLLSRSRHSDRIQP